MQTPKAPRKRWTVDGRAVSAAYPRRLKIRWYTINKRIAPPRDGRNPIGVKLCGCPDVQCSALATKKAINDPAIPMALVTRHPPGCLPGTINFASAPTISPMIKAPSRWNSITHRLFANSDAVNHSRRFAAGFSVDRSARATVDGIPRLKVSLHPDSTTPSPQAINECSPRKFLS